MRKSMGDKRKQINEKKVEDIVKLFYSNKSSEFLKDFDNDDFGYTTIVIERPLKDENGKIVLSNKGKNKGLPQPDPKLRDTENVPFNQDIKKFFKKEILIHTPDAWIDHSKSKIGYEIPFTRHFYKYEPPRPIKEIDRDLKNATNEIQSLLNKILK